MPSFFFCTFSGIEEFSAARELENRLRIAPVSTWDRSEVFSFIIRGFSYVRVSWVESLEEQGEIQ